MTFSIEMARLALLQPAEVQEGKMVTPRPLLPSPPITDQNFDARTVATAIDNLLRHVSPARDILTLARLLGLGYCFGTIQATSDTHFTHTLGRLPLVIVHSLNADGQDGRVLGRPEAGGPNTTPWGVADIYVRASVSGRYAFLVI